MTTPEDQARKKIDVLLRAAGWSIQDPAQNPDNVDLTASSGVAIRSFPLARGYGFADYLLYVDRKGAGVIEAKKECFTLAGVEVQAEKYNRGLPFNLPVYTRPLPFLYQSTGIETRFTNGFDSEPRSRSLFAFHKPETLKTWLEEGMIGSMPRDMVAEASPEYGRRGATFQERMWINMPPLIKAGLWSAQIQAIKNLEQSLRENRPRALIQMATGTGKTFTAINFIYRLIKFSGARRVLFLVDRGNLGDQTLKEFQRYVSPYNNFKFTEEYIVQRLSANTLDPAARVCISTIQHMYAMLKEKDLAEEEEKSVEGLEKIFKTAPPIEYNPKIPIETFDIIVTDECHRSIYNLWAQVLEYFDATLIGLTANPDKGVVDFFNRNLVMDYGKAENISDGLNVITDMS